MLSYLRVNAFSCHFVIQKPMHSNGKCAFLKHQSSSSIQQEKTTLERRFVFAVCFFGVIFCVLELNLAHYSWHWVNIHSLVVQPAIFITWFLLDNYELLLKIIERCSQLRIKKSWNFFLAKKWNLVKESCEFCREEVFFWSRKCNVLNSIRCVIKLSILDQSGLQSKMWTS